MAISFGSAKGTAQTSAVTYMKLATGRNVFRIIGGLLPRYCYWVKNPNTGKEVPFECIQFNRELEKFINSTPDPIKDRFPELRCKWSYACQVINRATGKVEVLQLKKDILEGIMATASQMKDGEGVDPSDPIEGIEFVVERKKTGPNTFDVSYTVLQLASKQKPLSEEDLKLVAAATPIDDLFPVPTYKEQAEALDAFLSRTNAAQDSGTPSSAATSTAEAVSDLDD